MDRRSLLAALAFGLASILAVFFCLGFSSNERSLSSADAQLAVDDTIPNRSSQLNSKPFASNYDDGEATLVANSRNVAEPGVVELLVRNELGEATAAQVRYLPASTQMPRNLAVVAVKRSQQDGYFRLDFAGSGWLLVAVPGACPQYVSVEQPGQYIVSFPRATAFSGHVTVDGKIPQTPLELVFESSEPAGLPSASGTAAIVPEVLRQELCIHRVPVDSATGRFELRGLSQNWLLKLRVPVPYRLDGGQPAKTGLRADFDARSVASRDVVINLTRAPSVHGRLLANETTGPQGAKVSLLAVSGDHRQLIGSGLVTDTGDFEIPWWPETRVPNLLEFELDYLKWTVAIAPSECPVISVGEIVIPDCDRVSVRVLSAETGTPIEGAFLGRSRVSVVGRTDVDGQLSILADGQDLELDLIAAGYQFSRVNCVPPSSHNEVIELTLKPAATITVTCRDLQDRVVPRARILVTANQSILRDALATESPVFRALCGAGAHFQASSAGGFANLLANDQGQFTIPDARPDVSLDFTFATYGKNENGRLSSVVVHESENKDVLLRSERLLRSLRIKVQTSLGDPVPAATLRVGPPLWKSFQEISSDAQGSAMVANLPFEEVIVEVTAIGSKLWRETCVLSSDATELLVVLETAHQVDLAFMSADGAPMSPLMCLVRDPGFERGMAKAEEVEPGVFRATVASETQFSIEVVVGIAKHRLRVDAADGSFQKLILPKHTTIRSELPQEAEEFHSLTLALKAADGSIFRLPLDAQGRVATSAPAGDYEYWFESLVDGTRRKLAEPKTLVLEGSGSLQLQFP